MMITTNRGLGICVYIDNSNWYSTYVTENILTFPIYKNGRLSEPSYNYTSTLNNGNSLYNEWIHVSTFVGGTTWTVTLSYNGNSYTQSATVPYTGLGSVGFDEMWGASTRYVKNIKIIPL